MNPATVLIVLQLVQAIIAAAPSIVEGVKQAKLAIDALFSFGIIDDTIQNATKLYVDGLAAIAELGVPPPHWQVRPNPV